MIEKKLLISRRKYRLAPVVAPVVKLVPHAFRARTSLKIEEQCTEDTVCGFLSVLRFVAVKVVVLGQLIEQMIDNRQAIFVELLEIYHKSLDEPKLKCYNQ